MSVLCRAFGHDVARRLVQLDPVSFESHSRCKRCGAKLVRRNGGKWEEAVESVVLMSGRQNKANRG